MGKNGRTFISECYFQAIDWQGVVVAFANIAGM